MPRRQMGHGGFCVNCYVFKERLRHKIKPDKYYILCIKYKEFSIIIKNFQKKVYITRKIWYNN